MWSDKAEKPWKEWQICVVMEEGRSNKKIRKTLSHAD